MYISRMMLESENYLRIYLYATPPLLAARRRRIIERPTLPLIRVLDITAHRLHTECLIRAGLSRNAIIASDRIEGPLNFHSLVHAVHYARS